ncbi:MAG TPA: hypothetical protein VKP02_05275 [Gemmatimonadaceae bacterium]|nr:hypothetical protein [Gemmatimonadaceae bacterium]
MSSYSFKRGLVAAIVLLHALAHASVGMWAFADGNVWVVEPLWGIAMLGYFAAAFGIMGMPLLRRRWKEILVIATFASMLLLLISVSDLAMIGISIDVVILVAALVWEGDVIDAEVSAGDSMDRGARHHLLLRRAKWAIAGLFLLYAGVVVLVRPTYLQWGTTADERVATLPGDELAPNARYRIDHAITIHAPANAVWPWIAQLGQDRGGFYSYDWLERLFGDDIHNADRIHPEWQQRLPGDFVPATQPDYLGGRFGALGWSVVDVVPERALVLRDWGAFVVQPVDDKTSRLIVRTRGDGLPSAVSLLAGPFTVFVFEPAHFIMQRAMLRGVRDRAERAARS